ncbi:carbohydrate ABC transporter permease [Aestuariimicrobium ganziense]|uniref:carbohydrate ABC transporter permease n=1 Tax=Aestuariimicrobium ganziense TaxID=2773677 RepID=UPI0019441DCE|nr:sugar ABC transporter permease [Aestuariimicrobium ganziense]
MSSASTTRADTTVADPGPPSQGAAGPPRGWKRYQASTFYAFVGPWVLGLILLTAFPMGFALWMSFTNYDGISPSTSYVGFDNYARALEDVDLRQAMVITLLLMFVVVPLTISFGLMMALLVNAPLRERSTYRAILYLPAVLPVTAGAMAFRMVFDQDVGPVNGILSALGMDVVPWLTGNDAFWVLFAYMMWGIGGSMVISLAALQGVPLELHEAAAIDGAGAIQRFFRITLPMISPLVLFQVITGVIGAIQMFVPVLIIGNDQMSAASVTGVPSGMRVYMLYVYQTYFAQADMGYASAMLWLLFIVIVLFTAAVFLSSRRFVYYATGDRQ